MAQDDSSGSLADSEAGKVGGQAVEGHAGLLAIFEGIDEPVYVADPTTHELLFVNRATIRLFGPPDQRLCYEYLQQRSDPCPYCTNDKILGEYLGRSYVWESRNEAVQRWYKCIDKAIPWPDGRLVRYEMAIDIHERKLAEDAVRESERRLRALGDNLPGGMVYQIEIHRDGTRRRFSHLSAGVEVLHGLTVEEALADSSRIYNQIHEEDRARLEHLEQDALQTLTPFRAEVRNVHPSGEVHWRLFQSAPRILSDGRVAWDGVELDITELKRGEMERDRLREQLALAQRMESVGRLAGGVAHDFNNMLAVIAGHAEMALERAAPEDPLRADLLRIHEAAERSSRLTRQLLAFARRQTAAPRVLDLNGTVEAMLPMLRQILGEGIELSWRPDPEAGFVRMDPSQVDQILANLLLNARDATGGTGRVTLETAGVRFEEEDCTVRAGFTAGDYVLLSVSDDGIGMDGQTLSQVFEPFFTTKDPGQGTGLGLPTVYGILRQNSGFVSVYSEPGQGTTFKLYLPRCAELPTPAPCDPEPPSPLPPTRGPQTILLVEDEPMIRDITRQMLEKNGYCVLSADNPSEALHLARHYHDPIHLLLTDVVMPRMSGRELARRIAEIHSEARQLYMSGYTANVIAHHGVLETGVHFLQKPFSLKVLLAKVHEALA